jgi:hypothetical protein
LAGVVFGMCIITLVSSYAAYIIKFTAFLFPLFF